MSEGMRVAFAAVALVCMIVGFALSWHAVNRYGTNKAPRRVSFNPRTWRLVYLTRDGFTESKGFWLYIAGIEVFCGGPLLLLVLSAVYF